MRLTARRQFAGVQKAQDTARKKGGASGTEAASPGVASWDGSPKGGDGLPAPFTTARPDARGAGEGIRVQHHRRKNIRRITQSVIFTPERSVKRCSRTPAGGASARPQAARQRGRRRQARGLRKGFSRANWQRRNNTARAGRC
ncbi:hypothetical protein AHX56_24260 [Salmonella enterica subsp. enterica]|nr:hypothetical protein [Salmonella enterica subsp. enterica]